MSNAPERTSEKAKVFISYSRADGSPLADELVPGLDLAGYEPFLDKHDIEKAVDWEERLGALILRADFFIFIITPSSIRSPRCQWEVDRAAELGKRIVPVQWLKVVEAEIPERLRRLNYVIFDEGQSFARPLAELVSALRQDVQWIRAHTILGEQATRWKDLGSDGKGDDLLLRGSALADAQTWLKNRRPDAPEITELQRTFIMSSSIAEKAALQAEYLRATERNSFVQQAQISKKRANYAQITLDAIISPSRVSPLITCGDSASLKSAAIYWFTLSLLAVLLNSMAMAALGVQINFGDVSDNPWLKAAGIFVDMFQKYQIAGSLIGIALYVAIGMVWYLGIRCLVSGKNIPPLGFFQSLAYPTAALSLLYLPFNLILLSYMREVYTGSFDAGGLIASRTDLSGDPVIRELCANASTFMCRVVVWNKLNPNFVIAQQVSSVAILAWMILNTSTVIKGVTGLRRRRTLSGLLISLVVTVALVAGATFLYLSRNFE